MTGKRGQRPTPPALDTTRAGAFSQPSRQWLFFRYSSGGRAIAEKELRALGDEAAGPLTVKMQRHIRGESRGHDIDYLGDGIFEIRHRVSNKHYRVLFMAWGRDLVVLTAFYKNQRTTPKTYLERAKVRASKWRRTHSSGDN